MNRIEISEQVLSCFASEIPSFFFLIYQSTAVFLQSVVDFLQSRIKFLLDSSINHWISSIKGHISWFFFSSKWLAQLLPPRIRPDTNSIYNVHPGDGPNTVSVSPKLTKDNYQFTMHGRVRCVERLAEQVFGCWWKHRSPWWRWSQSEVMGMMQQPCSFLDNELSFRFNRTKF